jgi:glucose-1-phosphatase
MIKALIFDLGNTIVPFDFKLGYANLQRYGPYPVEEMAARLRHTDLFTRYESGQIESRPFFEEIRRILSLDMPYEEFPALWFSVFLPHTLITDEWLAALGARYPLVLLSNTNELHFEWLIERYPILHQFKRRVLSNLVGAMKPSPIIYEKAIELAGCKPGECFFTDDIPAYIEGAIASGIDAVRFESQAQIERELKARGVVW